MAQLTDYRIRLASLSEGKHALQFHCGTDFFHSLEATDILDADLEVGLSINVRHEAYALTFNINGHVAIACDRCLEAVEVPIEEEYRLTVRYGEDYDDSADDVLVIPQSMTSLDVAPIIRDTVLLALPIRCIHPDGECNPETARALAEHTAVEPDDDQEI